MARPGFEITAAVCKKAKRYAAQGLSVEQIASCLGMGERTLYEKQAEHPQFAQAIKDGRASGIEEVTNALYDKAVAGDNVSMIFFLKNRNPDRWEELQKRKHGGNVGFTDMSEEVLDNKLKALLDAE